MYQILIVEDDMALNHGITIALKSPEYSFIQVDTLEKANYYFEREEVDLILLDINLPDGTGLEFLKKVKNSKETPVILITANDLELDIVTGLELGAEDYITKPFSLMVLRARVHAQIRRIQKNKKSGIELYQINNMRFDFEKMVFEKGNQIIELSKTEQKLLRFLVENKGITLTRAKLVDKIWTNGAQYVDENALSVAIKRLRNKLEDNPSSPVYIKTVYGLGYTWMETEE